MSNERSIRVAIIEDESVLRKGLAKRITADPRFVCTDVFGSAEALLAADFLDKIDVFLIDIGLPGISGITLIERLRSLGVPGQMLMLTNFDDDANVRSAIMAGARGYLLKTTPPSASARRTGGDSHWWRADERLRCSHHHELPVGASKAKRTCDPNRSRA
ncbi:MAG: response regulator transcription factor [Ignavibacteria bacterium]|nr:response regulator transcription factor [Ignavibacteria bacterium]